MSYSQKNCVLYTRVSSKEQEKEGFSIPAQQKLLRTYAIESQFLVAKEFQDIETARQSGRVGSADMMNFLTANPTIKTLLVEKTDRLYRNLKDWVTIDELDLEIHFVKENEVLSDSSRSSEKFMHGIRVLMAKNYIDNLSEETRKGMNEKAEQGIWPSFAPLGYLNITGDDGKKIIIPDKDNAQFIVQLMNGMAQENIASKNWLKWPKSQAWFFVKVKALSINQPFKRFYATVFTWVSLNGTNEFTKGIINRLFLLNYGNSANKSYLDVTACALKALNINLHSAD